MLLLELEELELKLPPQPELFLTAGFDATCAGLELVEVVPQPELLLTAGLVG